eukprot:UN00920
MNMVFLIQRHNSELEKQQQKQLHDEAKKQQHQQQQSTTADGKITPSQHKEPKLKKPRKPVFMDDMLLKLKQANLLSREQQLEKVNAMKVTALRDMVALREKGGNLSPEDRVRVGELDGQRKKCAELARSMGQEIQNLKKEIDAELKLRADWEAQQAEYEAALAAISAPTNTDEPVNKR